jgi:hypothetical protein
MFAIRFLAVEFLISGGCLGTAAVQFRNFLYLDMRGTHIEAGCKYKGNHEHHRF